MSEAPVTPEAGDAEQIEAQPQSSFSQQDVDRLISKARSEERRKATEKFADYDDLKTRADGAKSLEDRVASIEQAARDSEARAMRADIALAKGLTASQAKRLVGATKEELEADADELLADIGAQQTKKNVVPTEGKNPKPTDSDERQFVRGLFGELITERNNVMAVFGTADAKVLMPRNIADGMITSTRSTSVVAQLSNREPQRFGEVDYLTFNDFPKMEYVEEGANKASTTAGFGSVTAKPHKGQVTLRFNEEVQWADEDYQLGIMREIAAAGQTALARGLDLGLIHRINPLTGTVISGWDNHVTGTTKRVELASGTDADASFKAAVGLLITSAPAVSVNGAAFDPKFSWSLANLMARDGSGPTSQQRYPTLGFGTNVTDFMGIPVAQGDTVSGTPEATDTKVRGIVGDFQNGIRWGVQRELPVEIIRFGDPDGQGDLKRKNQIALRLEIVYGWYVFEERFAVIEDAVA